MLFYLTNTSDSRHENSFVELKFYQREDENGWLKQVFKQLKTNQVPLLQVVVVWE